MSCIRDAFEHDASPPPSPSLLSTPPLRPSSSSAVPLRRPSPYASSRSVVSHLHDDSEWSPPVPRSLGKDMPILPNRYSFSWPNSSKPVDPDAHTVWLFDNTAFRLESTPDGSFTKYPHQKSSHSFVDSALAKQQPPPRPRWQVEYVAAYFAEKLEHDPDLVARGVCKKLGLAEDDSALETIKRRLEPFVTPVLSRSTIRIEIDRVETQTLGPGSTFGISSSVNRFHFEPPAGHSVVTTSAAVPTGPAAPAPRSAFLLPCSTVLAEPYGWGIISDIDDAIKITMTASALGILKTTFVDEPQAVRGMPELYAHMNKRLADPAWFYLSASPYNLYSFLRNFRKQYYPDGTIILRDASWQNLAGLISSLVIDVQEYKVNRMMKMHGWFPRRSFICIGDSTQTDPESYAEVARRYPGWVKAIFIRRVKHVSGLEEEKNGQERFRRAFQGLQRVPWHVFDEPEEIITMVDDLARGMETPDECH